MLAARVRQWQRWQQGLLLLIVGTVVGYPSLDALGHCVWHSCPSLDIWLFLVIALASATAFISGILLFLAISAKTVISKPGSVSDSVTRSPATTTTISSGGHPSRLPDAKLGGNSSARSSATVALTWLRIAMIAAIALAGADMLRRGWPSPSSRYGRYYLLSAVLTLLLSQFPFVVAVIRTWKIPDHAGLALAMAAGTVQVFETVPSFYTFMNFYGLRTSWALLDLMLSAGTRPSWVLLDVMLGATVVVLACLVWRTSGWLKGDAGVIVSIVFGFLAYTVLWRIGLSIMAAHQHVP